MVFVCLLAGCTERWWMKELFLSYRGPAQRRRIAPDMFLLFLHTNTEIYHHKSLYTSERLTQSFRKTYRCLDADKKTSAFTSQSDKHSILDYGIVSYKFSYLVLMFCLFWIKITVKILFIQSEIKSFVRNIEILCNLF